MSAKEMFQELRLFVRDVGVLLSAMPLEAGKFEEVVSGEDKDEPEMELKTGSEAEYKEMQAKIAEAETEDVIKDTGESQ